MTFYKNKADNYTYQPKITVMNGKYTLNLWTDYTVRYERCTQAEIKTYLDALQGGGATEEELEHLNGLERDSAKIALPYGTDGKIEYAGRLM